MGAGSPGHDDGQCVASCDPERLGALERSGLGAQSDPELDAFASWARRALGVPAAAVSLILENGQVVPGVAGLGEPLESSRSVPSSHPLGRWLTASTEPLVVSDTRDDPRTRTDSAVPDPGMLAYAGIPLTDRDGTLLGALCAVDHTPREWTSQEVGVLTDIARACSTELRLRLAEHDASRERVRRDEAEAHQQRAFDRSQTLLTASQAFTDTVSVADVRARIIELLTAALAPSHIEVVVPDEQDTRGARPVHGSPTSSVIEQRRILHYPDRAEFDRAYPGEAGAELRSLGLQCVLVVPLPTPDDVVGAVLLGWSFPHALEPTDLLTTATLAGYAGHAVGRARQLSYRTSVAHEMQNAMLTTLPEVRDLAMAARYVPADSRETVGGDWFDAARLTDPGRPDDEVLMLSVGDIIGHSLPAVTVMGQVRCMLRQAAADHPGGPPSQILDSFEIANEQFDIGAAGTAVVAQLRHSPQAGGSGSRWSFVWTNAGHPPPILLRPDGTSLLLDEHDILFGFGLTGYGQRSDHQLDVPAGSVLFLYTDGLVERRDSDLDAGTDRLMRLLDSVRDRAPQEIVDTVVDTLGQDTHSDDVVAFAIRVPVG